MEARFFVDVDHALVPLESEWSLAKACRAPRTETNLGADFRVIVKYTSSHDLTLHHVALGSYRDAPDDATQAIRDHDLRADDQGGAVSVTALLEKRNASCPEAVGLAQICQGDLSYYVVRECRGLGVAFLMARLACETFSSRGLGEEISAHVSPENRPSIALLESLRFRFDRRLSMRFDCSSVATVLRFKKRLVRSS